MFVCLFVRYAFSRCVSKCQKIFHGSSRDLKKGRDREGLVIFKGDGGGRLSWVNCVQFMAYRDFSVPLIAGGTKTFA